MELYLNILKLLIININMKLLYICVYLLDNCLNMYQTTKLSFVYLVPEHESYTVINSYNPTMITGSSYSEKFNIGSFRLTIVNLKH